MLMSIYKQREELVFARDQKFLKRSGKENKCFLMVVAKEVYKVSKVVPHLQYFLLPFPALFVSLALPTT
jgi:hypothetical protein